MALVRFTGGGGIKYSAAFSWSLYAIIDFEANHKHIPRIDPPARAALAVSAITGARILAFAPVGVFLVYAVQFMTSRMHDTRNMA